MSEFELNLSDLAREAFLSHFHIAAEYRHPRPEPEHMLVALARLKRGTAYQLLQKAGATATEISPLVEKAFPRQSEQKPLQGALSDRTRAVMEFLSRGQRSSVGTGDLLYAIIRHLELEKPRSAVLQFIVQKHLTAERVEAHSQAVSEPTTLAGPQVSRDKQSIVINGTELYLKRETRWSRYYESRDRVIGSHQSKFADNSASITVSELESLWQAMDSAERVDFCLSLSSNANEANIDVLRFIMKNGSIAEWSCCAMAIALNVPKIDSVPFFIRAIKACPLGHTANLTQGLAWTKSPRAGPIIQRCLNQLWQSPDFLSKAGWQNRIAFDAICCIQHLIQLGEEPERFKARYEALLHHPHEHIRSTAIDYLAKHYGGIP